MDLIKSYSSFNKVNYLVDGDSSFDLIVEANSSLKLDLVLKEEKEKSIKGKIHVEKGGVLEIVLVDLTSSSCSVKFDIEAEEGSEANAYFAFLSDKSNQKHCEVNALIKSKNTSSLIDMEGVIVDSAKMDLLGNTQILKGAINSTMRQQARIADLSKNGKGQASPSLLIDENDVKASHGAVIGRVDDNALFYLMSRGLSKEEARKLIVSSYLVPVINRLADKETVQIEKREF